MSKQGKRPAPKAIAAPPACQSVVDWKDTLEANWKDVHKDDQSMVLRLPDHLHVDGIVFGFFNSQRGEYVWHLRAIARDVPLGLQHDATLHECVKPDRETWQISRDEHIAAIGRLLSRHLCKIAIGAASEMMSE